MSSITPSSVSLNNLDRVIVSSVNKYRASLPKKEREIEEARENRIAQEILIPISTGYELKPEVK